MLTALQIIIGLFIVSFLGKTLTEKDELKAVIYFLGGVVLATLEYLTLVMR